MAGIDCETNLGKMGSSWRPRGGQKQGSLCSTLEEKDAARPVGPQSSPLWEVWGGLGDQAGDKSQVWG